MLYALRSVQHELFTIRSKSTIPMSNPAEVLRKSGGSVQSDFLNSVARSNLTNFMTWQNFVWPFWRHYIDTISQKWWCLTIFNSISIDIEELFLIWKILSVTRSFQICNKKKRIVAIPLNLSPKPIRTSVDRHQTTTVTTNITQTPSQRMTVTTNELLSVMTKLHEHCHNKRPSRHDER